MKLNLSVKSIVAMVLLALMIVLLFWPSVAGLSAMGEGQMYSVSEIRSMTDIGTAFNTGAIYGIAFLLLNICFFGMIVMAVVAIVTLLLGKGKIAKIATILAMVLAILAVILCAVIIIVMKGMTGYGSMISFAPGVAMFLLPIFSLAASILYKRDTSYSGMFPVKQSAPAGQQPVYQPYAPKPEAGGWICPSCNSQNPENAQFCPNCGTPAPAPAPEPAFETPAFCSNCGTKLEPGSAFCPNCGAKQN
jgi:RNA polymerase subunit RPABC4/transcription elongation factor Spt4